MADNVLKTLFQSIADEIKAKTGRLDTKIAPADFPKEIESIEVGSGGEEVEAINDALDEINGECIGENIYTVTFIGADGNQLGQMSVIEGDDCPNPVGSLFSTPKKASTKYYGYSFSGWSLTDDNTTDVTALENITSDRNLYAVFAEYKIYLGNGAVMGDVYWRIDPDYVLEVYGSGSTGSYYNGSSDGAYPPWYSYQANITSVIIGEGVTSIGMYNFSGCTSLVSVSLQSGIKSLWGSSFTGCTRLASIIFPATLECIYSSAFLGCSSLTSAVFEKTTGWVYKTKIGGAETAIPSSDLDNPSTAATLLTSSSNSKWEWHNRELRPA